MKTLLMKGKPVADAYREIISAKIAAARAKGVKVTLAIIVVGDDPASHVYKDRLVKLVESLGGEAKVLELPETATQDEVIAMIKRLNHNRYVTGILPMMPMPKHIDGDAVGAAITMSKDVDCLNPKSVGEVFLGRSRWAPCTPRACMASAGACYSNCLPFEYEGSGRYFKNCRCDRGGRGRACFHQTGNGQKRRRDRRCRHQCCRRRTGRRRRSCCLR